MRLPALVSLSCLLPSALAAAASGPIQVNAPKDPPTEAVTAVFGNFFGISLELSFINYYFGNDTSSIPQPMLNYLSALHQRGSNYPVRLRLGGNSMDSSTYVPGQPQIIQFTDPNANVNDQPVTYGSVLFEIMKTTSDKIGVQWLIGLSLRDPNSTNTPLVAGDAQKLLGDDLDALLLGNEPDLYTNHGNRPGLKNYTVDDYTSDYEDATQHLTNTTDGDILSLDKIAGPTICCNWDLGAVLTSSWWTTFMDRLKYVTVQHYPQNNCQPGHYPYHLDYYMSHTQTVNLARWQEPALQLLAAMPEAHRKPLVMDEFNSASCGGVPESNMFGTALWAADYALQMASGGYSAAYMHTREHGVTYNIVDPPVGDAGGAGVWTTNANFYALLAVTEALQSAQGNRVIDLNLSNSTTDYSAVQAGYAMYDAVSSKINQLALFNYANLSATSSDYVLDASFFGGSSGHVLVRYMSAPTATETTNITWGNLTYTGVGDGRPVVAQTQWTDRTFDCGKGCTIPVPGPGMAVVFLSGNTTVTPDANNGTGTSSSGASQPSKTGSPAKNGSLVTAPLSWFTGAAVLALLVMAM